MAGPGDSERSDAIRNRALLLSAAKRLIDNHGAAAVTMDAVAREAGVGKGTVFRRFGGRAGLMMSLLDHSETEMQRSFLSGPPPLGPGAPAAERLVAYGRARLAMVCAHLDILIEADDASGPARLAHPAHRVAVIHVQTLLTDMGFGDAVPTVSLALLAPLEAASVHHLMVHEGLTVEAIGDQWERLVDSLTPA
ncbi:TetR/AcrR family transcriptional regulator [Williamsia sp.]|uniref:TetR/AcrR family transcriptional regulator n=1 Tax=Williamsia sp. TaxID=1872085 RepID=UPI001A264D4C|nr:TetR/AcrR family transcriptional regulator [Williamsia sp.]MBJ7289867.1 TetR/AcrR family transcriptional regulator [Williamsia sp.]